MANSSSAPRVGLANSHFSQRFVADHPGFLDFVEIPFEQLATRPSTVDLYAGIPLILHCASLGISAEDPPAPDVVDAVRDWVTRTNTPWIGEHLAFVQAPSIDLKPAADDAAEDIFHPYSVGYTVSPQMNAATLEDTAVRIQQLQAELPVPLVVENPPIYFESPGSTMHQFDFVRELTRRTGVGLLLDLAHFMATCKNQNLDIAQELRRYPVERIVEVHLSGVSKQVDMYWDDHAMPASPEQLHVLADLLGICRPQAITLEYNWQSTFPAALIVSQVDQIRSFSE